MVLTGELEVLAILKGGAKGFYSLKGDGGGGGGGAKRLTFLGWGWGWGGTHSF